MSQYPPQIIQFVDELVTTKGNLRDLHPEVAQEIKDDLCQQVVKVVNMALINSLPEADAKHCVELLEAGKQDEVAQIIDTKVTDPAVLTSALTHFRSAYLTGANQ